MSNIYIQEPPTNGKVLLVTTVGDIDIELWSKEAPKACRNFVQLCLDGYYDGTIFHRVVKNFIVQGGDPSATGTGGYSIYGKPFKDEFHQRLRFVRRGLVAMANAGPNDNGSQFFFTLGQTPELQNKHTIFAKVVGNTLYNMLKLGESIVDADERPEHPHRIIRTKILSNPYDDMQPRLQANKTRDKEEKNKSKAKATKDFKLLSFGDEAEEDEEEVTEFTKKDKGKSKSSHDLAKDPKLSALPAVDVPGDVSSKKRKNSTNSGNSSDDEHSGDDEGDPNLVKDIRDKLFKKQADPQFESAKTEAVSPLLSAKELKTQQLRNEANLLKKELSAKKKQKLEAGSKDEEEESAGIKEGKEAVKEYKAEKQKYKEQQKKLSKKGAGREEQTLALLAKFQNKLFEMKTGEHDNDTTTKPANDEDEDDVNNPSWMSHSLCFENSEEAKLARDANLKSNDWYTYDDPRNPMVVRRKEASEQAMKKQGRRDEERYSKVI